MSLSIQVIPRSQVEGRTRKSFSSEVIVRSLKPGEVIRFGDFVRLGTEGENLRLGTVVHGRRVLPSEAQNRKLWREVDLVDYAPHRG